MVQIHMHQTQISEVWIPRSSSTGDRCSTHSATPPRLVGHRVHTYTCEDMELQATSELFKTVFGKNLIPFSLGFWRGGGGRNNCECRVRTNLDQWAHFNIIQDLSRLIT